MDNDNIDEMTDKKCINCENFETRTHFCRLNPPIPMVFYEGRDMYQNVSSKWPVITQPNIDYCSNFKLRII